MTGAGVLGRRESAEADAAVLRSNGTDPATEEGTIVSDTHLALTCLPSGENVVVGVTSRNRSGESAVAEASILVT